MDLTASYTLDELKELAAEGALEYEGKRLMPDLFKACELTWHLEEADSGYQLSATVTAGKRSFPLHEAQHLGKSSPHWIIKAPFLRLLPDFTPWKLLQQAYVQAVLSKEDAQAALERLQDLDFACDAPGLLAASEDPLTVLPILCLQDRKGAFAQLWMRYGEREPVRYEPHLPPVSGQRDHKAELAWEQDLLETSFQRKQSGDSDYYCPVDQVGKSLSFLLECGWTVKDHEQRRVHLLSDSSIQLSEDGEAVHVTGRMQYDDYEASLENVVGAFNRREQFVSLAPNEVGLLSHEGPSAQLQQLSREVEVQGGELRLNKVRFAAMADAFDDESIVLEEGLQHLRDSLSTLSMPSDVEPADGFCGELRPYQQQGLNWLAFLQQQHLGGILADDMGLGKTVQVLAAMSLLSSEQRVLIVVPRSLLFHWKKEAERFLPDREVIVHHGKNRADLHTDRTIVTSYGMLRQDEAELASQHFALIILDESQAIKNPETRTARAAFRLQADCRLSLTGTPIENRLDELWSQFRFAVPGLLGQREQFSADAGQAASDEWQLGQIRKRIKPFLMRRCKQEVARDLPEKIEQEVWIEMDEGQRGLYERFLSGLKQNLLKKVSEDGVGSHRMEVFEAILRLRQICCHPLLLDASLQDQESRESGKFVQLFSDVKTVVDEGKKVLVYSQFTSMLNLIEQRFQDEEFCKWVRLDGSTRDREAVVEQFQSNVETQVFLISLKAGGTGLNLTAADYVFLYDPWWNEAAETQAIDRAHRIGRKDPVIAKRYVMRETVEEKMMKLKAAKRHLADRLLALDESQVLTAEDLLELLT